MARFKGLRKTIKRVGRRVGRIAQYAGPIGGALIGGPVGAVLGGVGGTGLRAATAGNREARRKALKRGALLTAGVAAGTAGIGAISGAGPGASLLSSVSRIFSPTTSTAGGTPAGNELPERPPLPPGTVDERPRGPGFSIADILFGRGEGNVGTSPNNLPQSADPNLTQGIPGELSPEESAGRRQGNLLLWGTVAAIGVFALSRKRS